jgi:hypothetical protein
LRNVAARDLATLMEEMRLAKLRFGLPADTPVLSWTLSKNIAKEMPNLR